MSKKYDDEVQKNFLKNTTHGKRSRTTKIFFDDKDNSGPQHAHKAVAEKGLENFLDKLKPDEFEKLLEDFEHELSEEILKESKKSKSKGRKSKRRKSKTKRRKSKSKSKTKRRKSKTKRR